MRTQLTPSQLLPNGLRYLLCLILIYRELEVELEMLEFNKAYLLKVNPSNAARVYMLDKQTMGKYQASRK